MPQNSKIPQPAAACRSLPQPLQPVSLSACWHEREERRKCQCTPAVEDALNRQQLSFLGHASTTKQQRIGPSASGSRSRTLMTRP
eukprot:scaffold114917_cov48-Phaeocystis_antarctica.AAC.1